MASTQGDFLTSQRGQRKLCFEGYIYTKKRSDESKVTWVCDRQGCPIRLLDFIEENYIVRKKRQADNGREIVIPPRYPPATWNVHDATRFGEDRTHNVCEGWNNGSASSLSRRQPDIGQCLDAIRDYERSAHFAILRYEIGGSPERRRIPRVRRDALRNLSTICQRYRLGGVSVGAFLRNCATNLLLIDTQIPGMMPV